MSDESGSERPPNGMGNVYRDAAEARNSFDMPKPSFFDVFPDCVVCDKTCYPAEQMIVGGKVFHFNDDCWSCGVTGERGCGRRLERIPSHYQIQLGVPYCLLCFESFFLEGYGTKANALERPRSSSATNDELEPSPDVQNEIGAHASAVFRLSTPVEEEDSNTGGEIKLGGAGSSSPSSSLSGGGSGSGGVGPKPAAASFNSSLTNCCPKCGKSVFKMEEIIFANQPWHILCFCCGGNNSDGCQRVLSNGNYTTQGTAPYCNACFSRLFKHGAAIGAVLPSTVRRTDSSTTDTSSKFAHLGGAGASEKCPSCNKTVYKMEAHAFEGTTWHKNCFTCGGGVSELGCKRVLAHGDYKAQAGVAFCNGCFSRHFMKAGARGAVLITASGALETRSSLASVSVDSENKDK